MTNPFETPKEVTEQEVIGALDTKGVEDTETVELLAKYANQCNAEANAEAEASPEDAVVLNKANLKADMKLAKLYAKTDKYKHMALAALDEAYDAASQDDSTKDLAKEISSLIDELNT